MYAVMARIFVLLLAAVLFAPGVWAGLGFPGANVGGTVTDQSGTLLPGAQVQITNKGDGRSRIAVTNAQGKYAFRFMPEGVYAIAVNIEGFKTQKRSCPVASQQGGGVKSITVNFILQVKPGEKLIVPGPDDGDWKRGRSEY